VIFSSAVRFVLVALMAISSQPSKAPITLSDATIGEAWDKSPTAELQIFNNTAVAVTAWSVVLVTTMADGRTERSAEGVDGYGAFGGLFSDDGRAVIPPHASLRVSLSTGGKTAAGIVSVRPALRYVIFADRSWMGDEADVKRTFESRQRDFEAFTVILRALGSARESATGDASVDAALANLNNPDQQDFENSHKARMRQNLRWAIEGSPNVKVGGDEFMRLSMESAAARLKAADEHRRPSAPLPKSESGPKGF
jgi:hypothetical protein